MSITKNEFYSKLELFAEGYGDKTIIIDKGHAQVIIENKDEALKTMRDQSETIKKLLKTQESDQKKVFDLEQEVEKLKYQLKFANASKDAAVAEGFRIQLKSEKKHKLPTQLESITGYGPDGKVY